MRFTRHGFWEMLIGTVVLLGTSAVLGILWLPLAILTVPVLLWLFAFFRDPERKLPVEQHTLVSPADGTVSDITPIDHDPLLNGPAIRVGIFLSVFNVHVNRSPCDGKVVSVQYKKGKFVNAMKHGQASDENESNTILLAEPTTNKPTVVIKQIVGLIARRIICTANPGDSLTRGQRIGMIKFGSRTELTIAAWLNPTITVKPGQSVRGGADILATLGGHGIHTTQSTPDPELDPLTPRATPT